MKKKIIACLSAAAMVPAALAPAASAVKEPPRPTPRQCSVMHRAVDRGESVPNLEVFVKRRTNLDGTTLRVVANTKYQKELRKAIQRWAEVSDGKIKIETVPAGTPGAVPIDDANPSNKHLLVVGNDLGVNRWDPPRIILNLRSSGNTGPRTDEYEFTRVMTIAHEMGHAMGIGHTCKGDGMSGYGDKLPTKYDAALVLQRAQRG